MDEQKRASLLDDLAADAGRKRETFLGDAGRQFVRFLDANKSRFKDLGGLVLIDDEPDYLFVSEDGTFRSRTRFQDDAGEWVTENEEITDGAALVEIFNPADLYAAFADAAQDEIEAESEVEEDEAEAEQEEVEAAETEDGEVEAEAAGTVSADVDDWPDGAPVPRDKPDAARLLYDLSLTFQERSQLDQAQLLDDFQEMAVNVAGELGDSKIVEDEDERLWFRATGAFEGEVVPERDDEGEPTWQPLTTPDDMVQFYDPTDLFGDLAEAVAESYPEVAPELAEEDGQSAAEEAGDTDDGKRDDA
jgi:hypothetical protein